MRSGNGCLQKGKYDDGSFGAARGGKRMWEVGLAGEGSVW